MRKGCVKVLSRRMHEGSGRYGKRCFPALRRRNFRCPKPFLGELSSVGSERLPYKQRVGGSTPSAPTSRQSRWLFCRPCAAYIFPLSPQGKVFCRELSSVGSERLPYKQRVGGSTPSAPTPKTVRKGRSFFACSSPLCFPFFSSSSFPFFCGLSGPLLLPRGAALRGLLPENDRHPVGKRSAGSSGCRQSGYRAPTARRSVGFAYSIRTSEMPTVFSACGVMRIRRASHTTGAAGCTTLKRSPAVW